MKHVLLLSLLIPTAVFGGIPEFFYRMIERSEFDKFISEDWGSPKVPFSQEEQKRLDSIKAEILQLAWNDYEVTSEALISENYISKNITENGYTFFSNHQEELLASLKQVVYTTNENGEPENFTIAIEPVFKKYLHPFKHLKQIVDLITKSKDKLDLPSWHINDARNRKFCTPNGGTLVVSVANTNTEIALSVLDAGADVNKYSSKYGNNPLLLATIKGWNHRDPEASTDDIAASRIQRPILEKLLAHPNLNVNAIDLKTGMTALHIACLRCDSPEFVKMLLEKGASTTIRDYEGRIPLDLLETKTYEDAKKTIAKLSGCDWAGNVNFGFNGQPNHCVTASLPTEDEYNENKQTLKALLFNIL